MNVTRNICMAHTKESFIKYGTLKTKVTTRNMLWFVQNFVDICSEKTNIRSDFFKVCTLPSCLFYLTLTVDGDSFTVHLKRNSVNMLTSKTSELAIHATISFEDVYNNLHCINMIKLNKDYTSVSSTFDQKAVRNFLIRGTLIINCTITVEEIKLTDLQKNFERLKDKLWNQCSSISSNELKEHLEILLEDETSNKVIISTDGENFPVHRNLLCTHSPVFSAMFAHETAEKQSNHIYISDIRKEVVGEMLKYMYTGCTSALPPFMNIELFIAADKYEILSLKKRCSNFLASTLTQELVLDILVLAHQHSDNDLKSTAIQFLLEKAPGLLENEEFLSFIESESEIIRDILLSLIRQ